MQRTDRATGRALLAVAGGAAVLGVLCMSPFGDSITTFYFWHQDIWVGIVACAALAIVEWRVPQIALPARAVGAMQIACIALVLALLLWAGTHHLMANYPLTRDEHMVVFDMEIFRQFELARPLPDQWRGFGEALAPAFLLDVPGHSLMVSGYMPGNAAMRAAFSAVGDPALMNPLLASAGLVALWDIARREFAGAPEAAVLVLAAYVLSPQVLVNAMTTYAMTGHLAVNLIWLALFLRGRWWQHALAMALGVWAIGLHQIVFHPLFAGPFLLRLLAQRRWRTFAAYVIAYGAGAAAWLSYPSLVVGHYGVSAGDGSGGGIAAFVAQRIVGLLAESHPGGVREMGYNLFRFFSWNPIFLLPFALLAWPRIRDWRSPAMPLAAGIVGTVAAMLLILPYQGHGWGYRYLHGVLGNFALLAGYGLASRPLAARAPSFAAAASLAAITLAVAVPLQLAAAHRFTASYARLNDFVQRQGAPFVIIDTDSQAGAIDTIRNRADLANRPLTFSSRSLTLAQARLVCSRGPVTLVGAREFVANRFDPDRTGREGQRFARLRQALAAEGCLVPAS